LNIIETLFHRQSLIVQGLLVDIAIVAIEAFGMEGVVPFRRFPEINILGESLPERLMSLSNYVEGSGIIFLRNHLIYFQF